MVICKIHMNGKGSAYTTNDTLAMSVSIERLKRSSRSSYILQVGKAPIHIDYVNADLYRV
jgi:hypothetical protein